MPERMIDISLYSMNTLLYHFGALGDFITTLPAAAAWKRLHKATITLLGKPAFGDLARKAGSIDACIDADSGSLQFLFRDNCDAINCKRFFAAFDAVLLFTAPDSPLSVNARNHSTARIRCQQPFPDKRMHIVDYHLSLVTQGSPFTRQQHTPVLSIPGDIPGFPFESVAAGSGPVVAIHPGSGSALKNWPLHCFLTVADTLRSDGCAIVWIAGPAETGMEFPPADPCVAGRSLAECVQLLSRCAVFLGNDSGMTHLAAAAGCPTIALFGPSDPVAWGPRGTGTVEIIHHPLPCAPCHHQPEKPLCCAGECMLRIHPEEVLAAVKRILRQ